MYGGFALFLHPLLLQHILGEARIRERAVAEGEGADESEKLAPTTELLSVSFNFYAHLADGKIEYLMLKYH